MSGNLERAPQVRQEWVRRVLGLSRGSAVIGGGRIRAGRTRARQPLPMVGAAGIGEAPRSGQRIAPPTPPSPLAFTNATGRKIVVGKTADGRRTFTSPAPPVREITFSGGGGKGAALPGAVKALEETGELANAKIIAGASVGSMTAALVAAGITAEEFAKLANDNDIARKIAEGSGKRMALLRKRVTSKDEPLTGMGLETVVRDALKGTLGKRLNDHFEECEGNGRKPDPTVLAIAGELEKRGPTFDDLRKLSKVIPAIKEVVITGTYTTELTDEDDDDGREKEAEREKEGEREKGVDDDDRDRGEGEGEGKDGELVDMPDGNTQGQLYVFDADSEPDLEVAIAVHASASFPGVFKPVQIKLSSGLTVTFIDGGVMNNTPTSGSLGRGRKLDPAPQGRGIAFVFEGGNTDDLLEGKVSPAQGYGARFADWGVLSAKHAAANYAKGRALADRPEEIVKIPLNFKVKSKEPGGKDIKVNMKNTVNGTLRFVQSMDKKLALQAKTEEVTRAQIEREQQPRTQEFASDSQMFMSIGMADLDTLRKQNYPGAADAYAFRELVAAQLDKLAAVVARERASTAADGGSMKNVLENTDANAAFRALDAAAGTDVDFLGYVARELNQGDFDALIDAMRKAGIRPGAKTPPMLEATYAVADFVNVQRWVDGILKQLVYPHMTKQNKNGPGMETLLRVEAMLRVAVTPDDVNAALGIAYDHFRGKRDWAKPKRGHAEFAQQIELRFMKAA